MFEKIRFRNNKYLEQNKITFNSYKLTHTQELSEKKIILECLIITLMEDVSRTL